MWAVVILSSLAVAGSAQIRRGAFPRSEAPSQGERAIARALIDDALREASGLKAAENLLVIRAAAASLLQDEDPPRASADPAGAEEALASVIALLNQQLTSVAAVDGFANGRTAFRNNELLLVGGGYPSPQYLQIIQQITEVSSRAPERALRVGRQLGTPELRAYSLLNIAGRMLRKPVPMFYGGGCSCY
jgi:hypothetical protein